MSGRNVVMRFVPGVYIKAGYEDLKSPLRNIICIFYCSFVCKILQLQEYCGEGDSNVI